MNHLNKTLYDENVRKILSNKQVLANVMKSLIPEYSDLGINEIVKLIEDGDESRNIKGMQNEDFRTENAKIVYDILFTAKLPNSDETIGMYIDIEAQNDFKLGYHLIQRAIYYSTRLIARQKGETFHHSDYGKMRKVYSIWICPNPKEEMEDSINRYIFKEEHLWGNYKARPESYDYIHILMLGIGRKKKLESEHILDLFRILFTESNITPNCKRDILNKEYDIIINEEEVSSMAITADNWIKQGIQQGFEQGKQEMLMNNIISLVESGIPFEKAITILKADDKTAEIVKEKLNII
ncbi:MAG: hypothetical protein Q4B60_04870 [Erysipelotrichaceae bacterium]|nr:hypothetical protein [Erysipelotrichaceae bacterium]